MTNIVVPPQLRERAYTAAETEAKLFSELENTTPERLTEIIKAIVGEAIDVIESPYIEDPEPPNGSMVKSVRANESVDMYERDDTNAPTDGGLTRPWHALSFNVWLTWELVVEEMKKRGPNGQAKYTVFTPQENN